METFSALLAICAGNSPVPGEFRAQRPVTRSFDVFFDLRRIKGLNKQSWGWWSETLSRPLWRHSNVISRVVQYFTGLYSRNSGRRGYIWTREMNVAMMTSWHGTMTSSNGNIFRVTVPLCGEPRLYGTLWRSFDVAVMDRRYASRGGHWLLVHFQH